MRHPADVTTSDLAIRCLDRSLIDRYLSKELDARELLAVDRHLAACDRCRTALDTVLPRASSFRSELTLDAEAALEHPGFETLARYIDGGLSEDEREILVSHTAVCAGCARELKDLSQFAEALNASSGSGAGHRRPLRARIGAALRALVRGASPARNRR
jgi:anti-sigma factor RsiW